MILTPILLTILSVSGKGYFTQADSLYQNRKDFSNALLALEQYREIYSKNPKSVEAAWRVSMACHFVGMRGNGDGDAKEALFNEGREVGEAGLALSAECAACHFWTAINMALYGQTAGVFQSLFLVKPIRTHLERVMELDRSYALGGAFRVLGAIKEKLPGILGGSNNEARNFYQEAIQYSNESALNYLFLIRLHLNELEEPEVARSLAEKFLSSPTNTDVELEATEAREEIAKLFPRSLVSLRR